VQLVELVCSDAAAKC